MYLFRYPLSPPFSSASAFHGLVYDTWQSWALSLSLLSQVTLSLSDWYLEILLTWAASHQTDTLDLVDTTRIHHYAPQIIKDVSSCAHMVRAACIFCCFQGNIDCVFGQASVSERTVQLSSATSHAICMELFWPLAWLTTSKTKTPYDKIRGLVTRDRL